ncbi:unspecific monooxygenase [Teladorsagia circumcincta]|uniref:Unspecific monooxygenase n=1 Tax=Teladorsagia circumcincta TaxID=45464 RepID=A0A2G9UWD3_TELCI|nr:unspecific monooxygenase [Teladorsagia circumcincta]
MATAVVMPPLPPGKTTGLMTIDAHPTHRCISWHAVYGPIYTVWLPHPMIVMASHEVLKEALIRQGPAFAGRPSGYIWSMFTKNPEHGDGIILCEGERWEQIREFAHKIFRNFGLGRTQMEEKIVHNINYMIAHIDSKLQGKKQIPLDLDEPISLCVANIIQDFVLGKSYEFGDPQFRKFKNLIDAVLEDMDGEPRDFMEAYLREMAIQRDNPHFNDLTLALASGDLWTGGMETTVTTLRWGFAYLLYHPSVQKKCYDEIYQVFGNEQPCYARRKQLPYVEATIAELQRITNVLPWAIPHRTMEDVKLLGFRLPKGTVILPQYGTVHHDARYFPEPDKFRPERFLDADGCFKRRPEMNPFGMGKRTCLGENLARYELFLLLTTLLQKYEFLPIGEGV